MALIQTGSGVLSIKGGFGGVYFSRDKFGLHMVAKPRRVHQRTAHQDRKRKAFIRARNYSHNNRTVSYNILRAGKISNIGSLILVAVLLIGGLQMVLFGFLVDMIKKIESK